MTSCNEGVLAEVGASDNIGGRGNGNSETDRTHSWCNGNSATDRTHKRCTVCSDDSLGSTGAAIPIQNARRDGATCTTMHRRNRSTHRLISELVCDPVVETRPKLPRPKSEF